MSYEEYNHSFYEGSIPYNNHSLTLKNLIKVELEALIMLRRYLIAPVLKEVSQVFKCQL